MITYYDILEVDIDAKAREIKSAYRKKAKKYHPDSNKNDKTFEEKFKEVNDAYETLIDEKARMDYDNFLRERGEYRSHLDDIDGEENKALNIETSILITSDEAYTGCSKVVVINELKKKFIVDIPRGTKNEDKIKLARAGYQSKTTKNKGDIIINIMVFKTIHNIPPLNSTPSESYNYDEENNQRLKFIAGFLYTALLLFMIMALCLGDNLGSTSKEEKNKTETKIEEIRNSKKEKGSNANKENLLDEYEDNEAVDGVSKIK